MVAKTFEIHVAPDCEWRSGASRSSEAPAFQVQENESQLKRAEPLAPINSLSQRVARAWGHSIEMYLNLLKLD